ncbi:hypothetical protein BCR32DRAFT_269419 [Anaeromyces robustus]|uniref:Uncharacterized protein n=1 Tax=Anaeromyces robustus TaxID=1754192 RepID=A0A1Y1X184_9FUNG|nr:hypothetical protein BCR32DRAFT_269419 [Anaeromyces robustus]|eukprot:ORX79533.1 hypothetical protein BCR32DRAFT_269419 [Anaeromyces robustus]
MLKVSNHYSNFLIFIFLILEKSLVFSKTCLNPLDPNYYACSWFSECTLYKSSDKEYEAGVQKSHCIRKNWVLPGLCFTGVIIAIIIGLILFHFRKEQMEPVLRPATFYQPKNKFFNSKLYNKHSPFKYLSYNASMKNSGNLSSLSNIKGSYNRNNYQNLEIPINYHNYNNNNIDNINIINNNNNKINNGNNNYMNQDLDPTTYPEYDNTVEIIDGNDLNNMSYVNNMNSMNRMNINSMNRMNMNNMNGMSMNNINRMNINMNNNNPLLQHKYSHSDPNPNSNNVINNINDCPGIPENILAEAMDSTVDTLTATETETNTERPNIHKEEYSIESNSLYTESELTNSYINQYNTNNNNNIINNLNNPYLQQQNSLNHTKKSKSKLQNSNNKLNNSNLYNNNDNNNYNSIPLSKSPSPILRQQQTYPSNPPSYIPSDMDQSFSITNTSMITTKSEINSSGIYEPDYIDSLKNKNGTYLEVPHSNSNYQPKDNSSSFYIASSPNNNNYNYNQSQSYLQQQQQQQQQSYNYDDNDNYYRNNNSFSKQSLNRLNTSTNNIHSSMSKKSMNSINNSSLSQKRSMNRINDSMNNSIHSSYSKRPLNRSNNSIINNGNNNNNNNNNINYSSSKRSLLRPSPSMNTISSYHSNSGSSPNNSYYRPSTQVNYDNLNYMNSRDRSPSQGNLMSSPIYHESSTNRSRTYHPSTVY